MKNHYGAKLRLLHWCTDQIMTEALGQMDLTASQGHIMGYLCRQETPACPRDLEQKFHLSHPTVSGILNRLEKKGFVELRQDVRDRRIKRIHVLPKGHDCHSAITETIHSIEQQIVQGFTQQEREQFSSLLDRAIENMCPGCCKSSKEESK